MARLLQIGKTANIIDEAATEAGTTSRDIAVDSDSIIASIWVESVSGDLDVTVYTYDDVGQETEVIVFPTISAPTSKIQIRKASTTLANIRVEANYTAAVDYRVTLKGIRSGSGDTAIKIAGYGEGSTTSVSLPADTTTLLIPSSLTDRAGINMRNWGDGSGGGNTIVYLGFSAAEATPGLGWPMQVGEGLAIDLDDGVELYAHAAGGTADMRVLQAGG